MIDRIRVRMLERVDSLAEGEVVNLPSVLADRLMAEGKAKAIVVGPKETKVVEPVEDKKVSAEEVAKVLDVPVNVVKNKPRKTR